MHSFLACKFVFSDFDPSLPLILHIYFIYPDLALGAPPLVKSFYEETEVQLFEIISVLPLFLLRI